MVIHCEALKHTSLTIVLGHLWHQGRYHFWRVVEQDALGGATTAPCVFLSWEWVFQGVSQRGISTECWVSAAAVISLVHSGGEKDTLTVFPSLFFLSIECSCLGGGALVMGGGPRSFSTASVAAVCHEERESVHQRVGVRSPTCNR